MNESSTNQIPNAGLRRLFTSLAGGRWLIAKHAAVDVLRRLHARQDDIASVPFEDLLVTRMPHLLFRFSDGH